MLSNYMGVINLDENEEKMMELTAKRPLASVPIAARYRVIDFVLSNMANAGMENIAVFVKNKSRSLVDHVSNGRPWDLNRKRYGLRIFNFGKEEPRHNDVKNFAENLDYFNISNQKYLILAPSYMIYNIDFNEVAAFHEASGNDITMLYKKVEDGEKNFKGCHVLSLNEDGRVLSVGRNLGDDKNINIGMEVYVMERKLFMSIVKNCVETGHWRKVKNAIHDQLDKYKVGGYEFNGYLSCVNSLETYYRTNMDFLKTKVNTELFLGDRPIVTKSKDESPTKYTKNSKVKNSIVANGSIIEGTVENCVISRRVTIGKGAVLKNCIILQSTEIGKNAELTNVIADKGVTIDDRKVLKGDSQYPLVIIRKDMF